MLLNETADKLFGPEVGTREEGLTRQEEPGEEDFDLSAAIAKEKESLEDAKAKERRFSKVDCGTQNLFFIRTTLDDPVALANKLLEDLRASGLPRTRSLQRLVPTEAVCKANTFDSAVEKVVQRHFSASENPSYCVLFKSRLSDVLSKEEAVIAVGQAVKARSEAAKVEYKRPDVVVLVEAMKSNVCLSAIPRYFDLKKCNLNEIVKKSEVEEVKSDAPEQEKNNEGEKEQINA